MKKIFIALSVACAAVAFTGCESLLDIPQKGVISIDDFYKTDEHAESALVNVYYNAGRFLSNTMGTEAGWNECPLLNPFEYASDDMFCAGENKADGVEGNQIAAFWYDDTNPVITGSYHCYYMIINACNQVLDHFAESADTQVKKRCVAEARVMRAYMHLMLAMGWNNPPLVDHVLDGADRPANCESQAFLLGWIADECDKALGDLDERKAATDKDGAVKITKGFCNAVKAKALMFKGDYAAAMTPLKAIISSGKYELVPSDKMSSLYHKSGDGSSESIFELNLVYDATVDGFYNRTQPNFKMLWGWRSSRIKLPDGAGTELPGEGPWGWCNPSKKFVDAIIANDGKNSARRKAWIKSYEEILYEMPYSNDATVADKKKDPNRGIFDAAGVYGNVGYFMWKRLYRVEDRTPDANVEWNMLVMRYAEVLLMYAECCAQTGSELTEGLKALNEVQKRAQANHISTECTLAEVKNEKFLECWLEGSRFPDLVRWGDAEKELADNGKYLPNYCDAMFSKGEAEHRGYIDESDATWCTTTHPGMGFQKDKHSYFPIPFAEKNVNPNIKDWYVK
jgi:hypothetical protein